MVQCKKYVANRQGTIFKSLIVTLKLPKALESEKKSGSTDVFKSITKGSFFKWHQQLNFLTLVHWLCELNATPRSFTRSKLTKLAGYSPQVLPHNDF